MNSPRIVLDANTLVAALHILPLVDAFGSGLYEPVVAVPLVLEYESAAQKLVGRTRLTARDRDVAIHHLCAQAIYEKFFHLS